MDLCSRRRAISGAVQFKKKKKFFFIGFSLLAISQSLSQTIRPVPWQKKILSENAEAF